jgi:hypothetical protein
MREKRVCRHSRVAGSSRPDSTGVVAGPARSRADPTATMARLRRALQVGIGPAPLLLCQPKVAGESTALLGFGTTLVEGERTGEVLTFRSRRLHYTIAEQVLS